MKNNILIVYFSYTGNTKTIAQYLQKQLNCDILELKPVNPYSDDYQTVVDEEQRKEGSNHLPEIQNINVNLNDYDKIIIGTPVWWYNVSPVVRTFLTQNDLSQKTVIPYATNAGWLGRTLENIKKLCPNSDVKLEKNIVFGSYSSNMITPIKEIDDWILKIKNL